MNIPAFAKPHLDAYQATGQLTGDSRRIELDKQNANDALTNLKDEFKHWQSLDESEADLLKGQPGAVRLASPYFQQDYTEARFSGDTQRGQLTVVDNSPTNHYGFVGVSTTRFTPQTAENFDVRGSVYGQNDIVIGPQLTHINREFASQGPIDLVGPGPISVTLTDHATGGFILSAEG